MNAAYLGLNYCHPYMLQKDGFFHSSIPGSHKLFSFFHSKFPLQPSMQLPISNTHLKCDLQEPAHFLVVSAVH